VKGQPHMNYKRAMHYAKHRINKELIPICGMGLDDLPDFIMFSDFLHDDMTIDEVNNQLGAMLNAFSEQMEFDGVSDDIACALELAVERLEFPI